MAEWKIPKNNYTAGSPVTPQIFNELAENERYLNETKITSKQVQDASVQSTLQASKENLSSSESVKGAFGKIRKWFSELRELAFKSTIGTVEIDNESVTGMKIPASQITDKHLAAGAVNESKIAKDAVTGEKIAADAISSVKIAKGAVTDDKISAVAASKVDGLAAVAKSGNYSDLTNKPSIPASLAVVNNLTSSSTTSALSAYQGKLLNDRISSLGFKQGNITDSAGSVVGTVKRQGNYVIGELKAYTIFRNKPVYSIPTGFRPKKRTYAFLFTYYDAQIWGVIETNGQMSFGDSSGVKYSIVNYGSSSPTTFGYEAA